MTKRQAWYSILYIQVILAIIAGVFLGYYYPGIGESMKPLGDIFIKLITMMIAPIIFCTVVHGIGSVASLSKVGKVWIKALFYFEVVSSLALVIGLVVGRLVQPGAGFNVDPKTLDYGSVARYYTAAKADSFWDHIFIIIPKTFLSALTDGQILQVLLVAVLCGVVLTQMGETGRKITAGVDMVGQMLFRVIGLVVKVAPIGAFGAMAFTIGKYGVASLINLAWLVGTFYLTSLLFVLVVLGTIARLSGFSILRFCAYIKDELLIVLGTSSSETVLPHMMRKMEHLGASKSVVGLVIPTGYSFNLDGTNIYMTLSIWFLAQATNTPLSLGQELAILAVAMLTSKGATGVTGAGFVTLAATLAVIPDIHPASLALLLGIDKFMSECRALTNLIGNGVACLVVSRWEGELDRNALRHAMAHPISVSAEVEREYAAHRA